MLNNCVVCGNIIPESRKRVNVKYCSKDCVRLAGNPNSGLNLPTGTIGAVGELIVATDLMRKGWDVFRALSPACPCDLIITHNTTIKRVEVRTGYRRSNGQVFYPSSEKDTGRSDVVAVVIYRFNEIVYIPEVEL